ncbi:M23 family metallopeptidase [Streptomyces aureoversilis]|uniref:M23 family metallopeptidase n=1 Tax=Streptomyces aureoversilis TaxID=67277 RepID=A0ABW0A1S5_9ACTN
MASNEPAAYEPAEYDSAGYEPAAYDPPLVPAYVPPYEPEPEPRPELRHEAETAYDPESPYTPASYRPSVYNAFGTGRGRHRVVKQRGGTMARSGAVLGVGVIAAVGAGGMAHAQERPATSISMPDLAQLPGVGSFFAGSAAGSVDSAAAEFAGEESASAAVEMAESAAAAGEVLRARILEQADHQQGVAVAEAQAAQVKQAAKTQKKAAERKAAEAEAEAEQERELGREQGRPAAPEQQQTSQQQTSKQQTSKQQAPRQQTSKQQAPKHHTAQQQAPKKQRSARQAPAAQAPAPAARHSTSGGFKLPLASYTLTAGFGQAGNMWSANHTGEDFAAPTGTPVRAVGGGKIVQAGWAGAYGYRIVLRLDDGTELWFCHLSSMVVTSGKVAPGQVIGRVGATGNVTGPHLHLEVRPGGGAPIDPLGWLRSRGLQP